MQNTIDYRKAQQRAGRVIERAHKEGLNPLGTVYEALIRAYLVNEQLKRKKP